MDIAVWLRSLGLQRFEQVFRRNAIEADVLPQLRDEHLRELGLPLGDRLRLLKAIAALPCGQAPERVSPPAASLEFAPTRGERRQVTAFFADIVGYTALIRQLGAEEIHELLARFFQTADRLIDDHGGSVDKHIGDCVMAVFGAPIAHGNDTERAVRTALAIRDAMPGLSAQVGHSVDVHIGIAGGQVVASRSGSAIHREYEVTGETVNLAACLTDAAKSGEILVSETVWQALADRLEGTEASNLEVKGFASPVRVWRLVDLRPVVAADRPPLVGRRAELRQFRTMLRTCRETGRGQAVYIRGEAGIGKTRLVEEFQSACKAAGFVSHAGLVLDFGAGVERDAIRALVRGLLDLDPSSDAERARAAAAAASSEDLVEAEQLVFLNDLLDVPQPRELRALYDAMDNASRIRGKQRTLARLVERASREKPRLLIVEDVHWANRSTLAHLAELTAAVAECPAILIMTSRIDGDQLDEAWQSRTRGAPLSTIDLGPLRREEAMAMTKARLSPSKEFAVRCVERAAGNPLFLEQLLCHAEENARAAGVPGSVQSLVQARLDQLDPADKQALQAASVLGHCFGAEVLGFILDRPDYTPERLIVHRLVRWQGDAVLFAHALVREAVYDTLLNSRRRALHRRAAEWFAERDPILYAEHLDRADDPEAPRAYLLAARSQAAEYRYERALALAESGLVAARDPATAFMLTFYRGEILRELGRTRDAQAALEAALAAAEDDRDRCRASLGLADVKRMTDDLDGAFADLEQAEAIAVRLGLTAEEARLHFIRGNLLFPRGEIEGCLREHQQALDLASRVGSAELQACALGGLGDAECVRGRFLSAYHRFQRCIVLSSEHGFCRIEVANRPMIAILRWYAGDTQGALTDALQATEAAAKTGHRRATILAHHAAYFCLHSMAELAMAEEHVETALMLAREIRSRRFEAQSLAFRGDLHRLAGRRREALEDLGHAVALCRETGMAFTGPSVLGFLALATEDARVRDGALEQGEALLAAGAVGHNHLLFGRSAIEACLCAGLWDRAEHYATQLETFIRPEPLPWAEFVIAHGRALAARGRGRRDKTLMTELRRLKDEGDRLGFVIALPAIERAGADGANGFISE